MLGARTIFAERENGVMTLRRGFEIIKGERVLVVEDVVTTGGSVHEVIALVEKAGATLAGVGYCVDRSNGAVKFDAKTFSVLEMDVLKYAPDEVPAWLAEIPVSKPGSRGLQ